MRVIASDAKQSSNVSRLDCFFALSGSSQ